MELSFIIINYKSEQDLIRCLYSLKQKIHVSHEIILVNNDQDVALAHVLPQELQKHVKILETGKNVGFAKACNLGASVARGMHLFFLNPDTEFLDGDIEQAISYFNDPTVGIVAPRLVMSDRRVQPWSCGTTVNLWEIIKNNAGFSSSKKFWTAKKDVLVDWISGAAFLITRKCWKTIKGFDEDFFMYFEDVDLCLRAQKNHFKIMRTVKMSVLHWGGKSQSEITTQKNQYFQSQDLFFQKHCGPWQTFLLKKMRFIQQNMLLSFFWFFCALLPFQFALNPGEGFDLAIARIIIPLLLILTLFQHHKKRNEFALSFQDTLILVFLFLTLFSVIFSHNLFWSIRKLAFLFSIFPIYFIAKFLLGSSRDIFRSALSLTIGGAFLAIAANVQFFCQFLFGIDRVQNFWIQNIAPFFLGETFAQTVAAYPSLLVSSAGATYLRATATFPDPHMLSYFLGMLIPWILALAVVFKQYRRILYVFAFLMILGDIFTFTRGGYLALIAGSLITIPLVSRDTAKKICIGGALLLSLLFVVPQNPIVGRLSSSFDTQEGSNQGRIFNWHQAIPVIIQHPLGVGIGMYPLAVSPNASYREPIYAHDLYLDIAAELGIPALLVFLSIIISAFKNFWLSSKKNSMAIAGVSSIVIFSVHSLVETPLYSVHVLPLLLLILLFSEKLRIYAKNL